MPENKTILITGSGGFIGTALAQHFGSRGWNVIGTSRNKNQEKNNIRFFDLDNPEIDPSLFDGVDVLIHAAFTAGGKKSFERNISGTKRLLVAAEKAGISHRVFLSSLAAHSEALSDYGQQKLAIEKLFTSPGDVIIRPGLVLGEGGLFGRMKKHLEKSTTIPIFGKGDQPLQTIHISDLAEAIVHITEEKLTGTFTLAEKEAVSYREFYETLCALLGKKPRFVKLPFWFILSSLAVAKAVSVKAPIDRDNILGLKKMIRWNTEDDLKRAGISPKTWKQSLEALTGKGRNAS